MKAPTRATAHDDAPAARGVKFREIVRFELACQIRRVAIWFFLAIAAGFPLLRGMRPSDGVFTNSPSTIAFFTVLAGAVWLLLGGAIAGDAAARDVETRMHPLIYTAPLSKAGYLGGRFLAAFVLNASLLLAVPLCMLLVEHTPGMDATLLGPSRPAAYLSAYLVIALPNAFVVTAIQFSFAVLTRRAIASYLAGVLLLVISQPVGAAVATLIGRWELAQLVDLVGFISIVQVLEAWTPAENNTRLIALEPTMFANRLLWVGVALSALAFTYRRFHFGHHAASSRIKVKRTKESATPAITTAPRHARTFGLRTQTRQMLAIASASFRTIARSRVGLGLLAVIATIACISMAGGNLELMGVPLWPRTDYVLTWLTAPLTNPQTPWVIIPLLIVFYAGELVWRERDAGLHESADAAPVPEWALFAGKFLGLGLILAVWMAFLTMAGIVAQAALGHHDFQLVRYLQVLFGLQLADYLLFALLVLALHVLVNQKHLGYVIALVAYGLIAFATPLGLEHRMLVYGSDPGWSYTDMRGFGASIGPWLWFKLYWTAWALLLAVAATLLWVRGRERGLGVRLQVAGRRLTNPMRWFAAATAGFMLMLGGFVFYNTNVLNDYVSSSDKTKWRAEYERRYGQYEGLPQPRRTGTRLRVEIDPERRELEILGTYRLMNKSAAAIDTMHVAIVPGVETRTITFDRISALVRGDDDYGHRIYSLTQPLQPGESMRMNFAVDARPNGFSNDGVAGSIVANGTYLRNDDWLPAIGYQPNRELTEARERQAHGLAPGPAVRSLYDVEARKGAIREERVDFDAVIGTAEDQIAVAPGLLRRTWKEDGRRYFHYATDAAIVNDYSLFSARYAVREGQWNGVAIRIFHDPRHTANLDRMLRAVQVSLGHYSEEFGPYPFGSLTLVERPGHDLGMHADATLIDYREAFTLLNPDANPAGPDLGFSVVAHEVAHQWWGSYLAHPRIEGAVLLSETLAQYSALQVVKKTHGPEHVRRLILAQLRDEAETPASRGAVPLLRATDRFHAYRKGPAAMYALSEYIGAERVNAALRRFLATHRPEAGPLATSLDLYRELHAVTPPQFRSLLHDLFEANTFWELETRQATAKQTAAGTWQVTLAVRARKVVVDTAGVEKELPMDEPVQIGVFAAGENGRPMHQQMHRIRSGMQTITVTVPRKPVRAGVDPNYLLVDWEWDDNITEVEVQR